MMLAGDVLAGAAPPVVSGGSERVTLQSPTGDVITGWFDATSVVGKGTFKTVYALECSDGAPRVFCTFPRQTNAAAARDAMGLVADVFEEDARSLGPIFCPHELVAYGARNEKTGIVMKKLDRVPPSCWPAVLEVVEVAISTYGVSYSDVKSTNFGLDTDDRVLFIDLDSVTRPGNYNMFGSYSFVNWVAWKPPYQFGGESPDAILARPPPDTSAGSTYADAYQHYSCVCDDIADICDADVVSMRALTRYAALKTALVMKTTEPHPTVSALTVALLGSSAASAMYAAMRDDCLTSALFKEAKTRGALCMIRV